MTSPSVSIFEREEGKSMALIVVGDQSWMLILPTGEAHGIRGIVEAVYRSGRAAGRRGFAQEIEDFIGSLQHD